MRLKVTDRALLERLADRYGMSESGVVRFAIRYLDEHGPIRAKEGGVDNYTRRMDEQENAMLTETDDNRPTYTLPHEEDAMVTEYTMDNPLTGEPVTGTLGRTLAEREGEVSMVEWTPEELSYPVSIIRYDNTGLVFTPFDWEGPQPQTQDEIADISWMDWMGRPAIILDGWPTVIG
jgi:hypothetical protein